MKLKILYIIFFSIELLSCRKFKNHRDVIFSNYILFDSNYKNINYDSILFNSKYRKIDSVLHFNNEYNVSLEKNSLNQLNKIEGYWLNNPDNYGNYFRFDEKGYLVKYMFLLGDGNHDSYRIENLYQDNKYEEKGSSFVNNIKWNSNNQDSVLKYTLYFSAFPRKDLFVFYSIDNKKFKQLPIHKSCSMPFLREVELVLNKTEVKNQIFIKTDADNLYFQLKGLSNKMTYIDTLHIFK